MRKTKKNTNLEFITSDKGSSDMRAVILAGGKGTRLKPYTTLIPKPLVPIGNELPILEIIIIQLSKAGFKNITIAVNHMANLIMAFFENGKRWNVKIDYSVENKPLSTIGPLKLIKNLPENFLVMNGDILCDIDYRKFADFHTSRKNDISVATFKRKAKIDYGVIKFQEENAIVGFEEKPEFLFDVSMGIYCINRKILKSIKKETAYGFDNLMHDGINSLLKMQAYPFKGFWLDIGRPDDYDSANENYQKIKKKLGLI